MAGYRQVHTKFWKDEWVISLEPLERYLFLYLVTNDASSISGIYELPMKVITNETDLEKEIINKAFRKFQAAKKIYYKDGVMWVVNMKTYHKNASPKTMTKVSNDVVSVRDCDVKIAYLYHDRTGEYSIDTVSILGPERERERLNKSKSKIEIESKSESETVTTTTTDDNYSNSPDVQAERIYQGVTGQMSFPVTNREDTIGAIQTIQAHKGIEIFTYLRPFWQEFRKRYPNSPGTFWLTDWALTGQIPVPRKNGNGHGTKLTQQEEWDLAKAKFLAEEPSGN